MKRYVALLAPESEPGDPDAWRLAREGFTPLGFLFSTPWLLVNRLWLAAAAMFALPLAVNVALGPVPSFVASLAVGLVVGFEGREWRIAKWERLGWRYAASFLAANRAEAEDRLAVLATGLATGQPLAQAASVAGAEVAVPPSTNGPGPRSRFSTRGQRLAAAGMG